MAQSGNSRSRTTSKADESGTEEAVPAERGEQIMSTTVETAAPEQGQQDTPGGQDGGDGESGGRPYLNVSGGWLAYDEQGHGVDKDTWTPDIKLDAVGRHYRDVGLLKSRTALGVT